VVGFEARERSNSCAPRPVLSNRCCRRREGDIIDPSTKKEKSILYACPIGAYWGISFARAMTVETSRMLQEHEQQRSLPLPSPPSSLDQKLRRAVDDGHNCEAMYRSEARTKRLGTRISDHADDDIIYSRRRRHRTYGAAVLTLPLLTFLIFLLNTASAATANGAPIGTPVATNGDSNDSSIENNGNASPVALPLLETSARPPLLLSVTRQKEDDNKAENRNNAKEASRRRRRAKSRGGRKDGRDDDDADDGRGTVPPADDQPDCPEATDGVCFDLYQPVLCIGDGADTATQRPCRYTNRCWAARAGFEPEKDCELLELPSEEEGSGGGDGRRNDERDEDVEGRHKRSRGSHRELQEPTEPPVSPPAPEPTEPPVRGKRCVDCMYLFGSTTMTAR